MDVAKQTPFGSDDILGEQAFAATDAGNVDPTNAVPDVAKLWLQGLWRLIPPCKQISMFLE